MGHEQLPEIISRVTVQLVQVVGEEQVTQYVGHG
jgi:ABC-type methionine transport system permease subunit